MRSLKVLNLLLAAVLAGIMLVIWIAFNPSGMPASEYVDRQQAMIRALNTPMPVLGAVTILLAVAAAYLRRSEGAKAASLVTGAVLLIGAGIITRVCNQPINATVMTWSASSPPPDWELLRDRWWTWHIVRTLLAVTALGVLFLGYRGRADQASARTKNA